MNWLKERLSKCQFKTRFKQFVFVSSSKICWLFFALTIAMVNVDSLTALDDSLRQLKTIYHQSKCDLKSEAQWQAPKRTDLDAFESLVELTIIADSDPSELAALWKQLGWEFISIGGGQLRVITEATKTKTGKGLYIIRPKSTSSLVLQSPHRFYDRHTGIISLEMFGKFDVFAVAWNTAHRSKIDLAHQQQHYLIRFTRALIRKNNDVQIVQIHGFSDRAVEDPNEKNLIPPAGKVPALKQAVVPDFIVSDSTRVPGRLVRSTILSLKQMYGSENALLFPLETGRLGGTRNEQARTLKSMGVNSFVHLELSLAMRQQLVDSASELARFHDAINRD